MPKGQQNMVSAALRQAFIQPDYPNARQTLRHVADQLRDKWPKLGAFIDESDADRVGAWPEKGIFDTQLGPCRNGGTW